MNDKDANKPKTKQREIYVKLCVACYLERKQKHIWNVTEGTHYILRHFQMENGEALLNLHAKFIGTFHFKYTVI